MATRAPFGPGGLNSSRSGRALWNRSATPPEYDGTQLVRHHGQGQRCLPGHSVIRLLPRNLIASAPSGPAYRSANPEAPCTPSTYLNALLSHVRDRGVDLLRPL